MIDAIIAVLFLGTCLLVMIGAGINLEIKGWKEKHPRKHV